MSQENDGFEVYDTHDPQCDGCDELRCDRCQIRFNNCLTMVPDLEGDGDVVGGLHRVYTPSNRCPDCGEVVA